jgi:hypothetical protein
VRTLLRTHQPRDNAIYPILGREVKEFTRKQRAESETLPIARDHQADLRDIIPPSVSLELQRSIGYDFVIVHHHEALDPASVELRGTSFYDPSTGDVDPQIPAIFFWKGAEEVERAFDIGGAQASHRYLAPVLHSQSFLDRCYGLRCRVCRHHEVPHSPRQRRSEKDFTAAVGVFSVVLYYKMRPRSLKRQESRRRI